MPGSFFTGVLAVIVATPCTAPFMGAAVGYALAQSAAVTFAVFTALALGLAAPYVLLTLQPAWTRLLAEARRVDGSVEAGDGGADLRNGDLAGVGAGADLRSRVAGGIAGLPAAAGDCRLVPGPLAGESVGDDNCERRLCWQSSCWVSAAPGRAGNGDVRLPASCTGARGTWEPWSADAVARYQAQGRPVFVDFTASWCLSCQVNERVALDRPEVQKAFADANVALLRADWTQHDESIAQALAALGRSGVPAYVLYTPGQSQPQLLPEVLTPGIVKDAVEKLPRTTAQRRGPA